MKPSDRHRSEPDYLWDPKAPVDPDIARLEQALAPLAHRGAPPDWPQEPPGPELGRSWRRRGPLRWRPILSAAAAALALAAGIAFWLLPVGEGWEVRVLGGAPRIDGRSAGDGDLLRPGGRLVTGEEGRARLALPWIGELDLEPGSELALLRSRPHAQRFRLERGTLQARVWAPPRVFQVETPAVRAIDLGCVYELSVDGEGRGRLAVASGWVALTDNGQESFVPAGAWAPFDRRGPGVPVWNDAPEAFQRAVARLETAGPGEDRRLWVDAAMAAAGERDGLTLWHLLARAAPQERGVIADRLAEIVPPPRGVRREAVLAGDRAALDAWWAALDLGSTAWWRLWRQPMP